VGTMTPLQILHHLMFLAFLFIAPGILIGLLL
jgi:hypothetical protein